MGGLGELGHQGQKAGGGIGSTECSKEYMMTYVNFD